jgi:hypothetical protein
MNDMRGTADFMRAVAIALLCGAPAAIGADDAPAAPTPELMKAMEEAGQPGVEHARLKPLEGRWDYTAQIWMDPSQAPMQSQGTIERKWILGGRFLEEKCSGTRFDGQPGFESLALFGYDKAQQKYTTTWVCNSGTGMSSGVGDVDGKGTTFTFATEFFCPLRKKTIHGRDEVRVESADKVVIESYATEDGREVKVMEIVSTRKR